MRVRIIMCAYSGHLALGHCRTGFDDAHVAINQISYCDSLILLSSRVRDISIILKQELCTGKQEGDVFFFMLIFFHPILIISSSQWKMDYYFILAI